jgi:predicted transcriptional regulator
MNGKTKMCCESFFIKEHKIKRKFHRETTLKGAEMSGLPFSLSFFVCQNIFIANGRGKFYDSLKLHLNTQRLVDDPGRREWKIPADGRSRPIR